MKPTAAPGCVPCPRALASRTVSPAVRKVRGRGGIASCRASSSRRPGADAPLVPLPPCASPPGLDASVSHRCQHQEVLPGVVASSISPTRGGLVHGTSGPPRNSRRSRRRLKVAVDVDEVLCRFVESLNNYYHATYDRRYEVSDYFEYCFRKVWNCSQDESNEIVHSFFDSHHFSDGLQPIPGAYEALLHLSDHVDLEVVTSRQNVIKDETIQWLEQYYPGVFQDIHFGNHWAKEGNSLPKSQICKSIGASCLIDDNPGYAVECAEAGIDVLLYDWRMSYPWSKTSEGPIHEKIQRVTDWVGVQEAVMIMARSSS